QQFKSFNLPYQLGYDAACAEDGLETGCGAGRFETPADADTTAYPVIPGDVIIIATDGLFDNVELDEICRIATGWEEEWFGGASNWASRQGAGRPRGPPVPAGPRAFSR
ncbi:unnamed protein product, partial [Heterosigma akashiwo]